MTRPPQHPPGEDDGPGRGAAPGDDAPAGGTLGIRPATRADLTRLGLLTRARERREQGACLVEGAVLLGEALAAGRAPRTVLVAAELVARHGALLARAAAAGAELLTSEAEKIGRISERQSEPGLLAAVDAPPAWAGTLPGQGNVLVPALCGLQDPGNVGTLLRSALAFGARAAWLAPGCADPTSPKVLRASAGAAFRLPLQCDVPVEAFVARARALDLVPVAARPPRPGSDTGRHGLPERCLLILGHETRGVPVDVAVVSVAHAADVESLNVAMAGSILMARWFEDRRVRRP